LTKKGSTLLNKAEVVRFPNPLAFKSVGEPDQAEGEEETTQAEMRGGVEAESKGGRSLQGGVHCCNYQDLLLLDDLATITQK